jgi:hypothetical protein
VKLTAPLSSTPPQPLLLTIRETAAALRISERTLWSMTQPRGPIPVVRIGVRTLYDPRALQDWIEKQQYHT